MATKESNLAAECRIVASQLGARLRRNNVGSAYIPSTRTLRAQLDVAVRMGEATRIPYGLGKGSSDDVGFFPLDGRAVVLVVEYKTGKVPTTEEQKNFLEQIAKAGGIAVLARSADDVRDALVAARDGGYPWGEVWDGPLGWRKVKVGG